MPPSPAAIPVTVPNSIFDPRLRRVTFTVLTIVALSAFEGLAVVAALPQVAADLGAVELLPWVVSAYMLTSGIATVAAGALVDRLGVRPVFRVALVVFLIGSVMCGFAMNTPFLVVGRAVQGIGSGAFAAAGLSTVGLSYPRRLVGRAFAANANVWGVMSVAGPALAALMLTIASWRWIFHINIPLSIALFVIGWNALPGPRDGAHQGRVRKFDLGLITAFSFGALLTVDLLDIRSLPIGLATLAVGAWVLRRGHNKPDALMAPRHAIFAPLGPLSWGVSALLIGAIGVQTFIPLFVSGARGFGTTFTAWSVIFLVIGWTSGANLSSRLLDRYQTVDVVRRGALIPPLALFGVAGVLFSGAPLGLMFACMSLTGLGMGITTNSGLTLVRELVDDHELGRATAAHQFIRNLGFALGNALVGAVLLAVVKARTGDVEQIRAVLGEGAAGAATLSAEVASAIEAGFSIGTVCAATVAALGVIPLWLHVRGGEERGVEHR